MKTSIYLALIHNNNQVRNSYIRPKIQDLVVNMKPYFLVNTIEVAYQPKINTCNFLTILIRDLIYLNLEYKWKKYRLLKSSKFRGVINFLRIFFARYFLSQNDLINRWKYKSHVEEILTDKHIRAWFQFLDSNAKYLIVLEDDAIFLNDSADRLIQLFSTLVKNHADKPCYVDLAGGVELHHLMIDRLEINRDDKYRYYKKPVTNTTCAYLVNRECVAKFVAILTRRPQLRLIGSDWMINNLFTLWGDSLSDCICIHTDPTIFKHGSAISEYVSWQADISN